MFQAEIVKRLNGICAQVLPYLSQEVSKPPAGGSAAPSAPGWAPCPAGGARLPSLNLDPCDQGVKGTRVDGRRRWGTRVGRWLLQTSFQKRQKRSPKLDS